MTDFWPTSAVWMLQTLAAGGVALLIAWMSLKRLASPSSRLSLAKNAMRVGVAAGVLTLLPAWLAVRVPHWMAPTQSTFAAATLSTPTPAAPSEVETPCNTDLEDDLGWHFEFVPVETVAALDLDGCEARVEPMPHHEPAEPRTAACAPDGASDGSLTETAIAQPTVTAPQTLLAAIAPILLIPYWVGVLVVLGRLVVGMIGLARLRQCAKSAPAAVQELVQHLAPDLAKRLPQVLVSDRVPSPICYGILRPTILLPRNLVKTVTTNQLKWVLAHELDHLRRGDPLTGVWVGLANAMFFWLPWFHAVRRELHVAQEHLADSAASTVAGQPVDYAEFLVELSTRPGVPRSVKALPSLAGVRAGQSELSRRIIMILQPQHIRETWWNRTFSALAISGALSSAIVLSGIRLAADDTTPQPAKKTVEVKIAADEKPVEKVKEEIKPAEAPKVRNVATREVKVFAVTDTSAIEKAIEEAVKKGDVAEAKKQIAKLKEATAPKGYPVFEVPVPPMPPGVAFVPSAPLAPLPPGAPIPPAAAGWGVPTENTKLAADRAKLASERAKLVAERAKMESKIDALKKAAEELKDQPEAKAALEKTIEAYTKQLAEAKKKFEEQAPRNMAWGYGFGQGAQPLAPEAMKNVMDQMTKVYEEQIKKLDDPKAKAAVQEAMKASKAAMEKMQKQLNQSGMLEFRTPQGQAFSFQPLDAAGEGFAKGAATFRAIAAPKGGRFGITFEPLPTTTAELLDLPVGKGVIVLSVADGSPAAKAGVKKNDIILEVAGKAVTNTDEIVKMVGEMKADKAFDVVVVRKGKTETIKGITLPEVKVTENAPKAATETKNSSTSLTTTINDNKVVRILASKDGVSYTIQGTIEDGKIVPTSITVRKGGSDKKGKQTETTVAKLSELSAEDQEAVKDFLSKVNVSTK